MATHRRMEESYDEGVDPVARLDELERTLVETLAEVELARRGAIYPWDAERHGKHARPARGTCLTCEGAVLWQDSWSGGWWIHEAHPGHRHAAVVAVAV
jgi:hypothetical protein